MILRAAAVLGLSLLWLPVLSLSAPAKSSKNKAKEAPAKAEKAGKAPAAVDFNAKDPFTFDMQQADAEETLKEKDWQLLFRIDTASVSEIAAVYKEQLFYRIGFYGGRCFSIEKRAQVPGEAVAAAFKHFGEQYGETPEATRNDDGSLVYSRWRLKNREASLMSSESHDETGLYKLTYEESDPDLASQARHAQEEELSELPMTIDPLTGRPRLSGGRNSGQPDSGGESDDKSDDKGDDKGGKDKGEKDKDDDGGADK